MAGLKDIKDKVVTLAKLYLQSATLSLVEGLSLFFGGIALAAIGFVCIILFMTFVSFGVAQELCHLMTPGLAYFIVALLWVVILILVMVFRQPLIYDPVVRFISKLIITKQNEAQGAESSEKPAVKDGKEASDEN